jgi:uncharacterized membrane protein
MMGDRDDGRGLPCTAKGGGMATLSVWKFQSAGGAEDALHTLERLQKEELVQVHDGAVVTWPDGSKKPKTRQLQSTTGAAAVGGAFWGFLFGLIFFIPVLGLAVGAAMGALTGSLVDVGIDDDFIEEVRDRVTPGTSALFLLTSDAVLDKVQQAFEGTQMELIHTNLSNEQERMLREAFGESD